MISEIHSYFNRNPLDAIILIVILECLFFFFRGFYKGYKESKKIIEISGDKNNFKIIRVVADIHPDGDVYIEDSNGIMCISGSLVERLDSGDVPNKGYLEAKAILLRKNKK